MSNNDALLADDADAKVPLVGVSDEQLQFSLLGSKDYPLVEVVLQSGCSMCAEPGRLIQLPEGVHFHTVFGDGTEAGFMATAGKAISRAFAGESIVLARFTNDTDEEQVLRFGTVIPGNIVPLKLEDYGCSIIAQGGAYFVGSDGLKIASCFKQKLGAAFFGGESFILQQIKGEGVVLLQGGGAVLKEELTPQRPRIRIDTGCLVAFTDGLEYNVAMAGGLKSWMFGGEGIFFATLSLAPGQSRGFVWVESFPYSKYIQRIKNSYPH